MGIDTVITDAFEQWLAPQASPAGTRAVERGEPADWQAVLDSGFADLLVPEARGGAGANLETAGELLFACGARAWPLALPTTLWARAALAAEGRAVPEGAIALALGRRAGDAVVCQDVAYAAVVDWVLVALEDGAWLLSMDAAEQEAPGIYGSLLMDLRWPALPAGSVRLDVARDWRAIGAALFAMLIAGAASRVLALSLGYAGERSQFGKPIGKFQAVQQQLAVLAEEVFAVRMAARLALRGDELQPPPLLAAIAKARASEAVGTVGAIGHMVHGAIGITEEYDLQLFTRRLHAWRLQFGSEAYWQRCLGLAVLERPGRTLDFIRRVSNAG
jgi:alkylation response protein AidB-like acyl-CoA dehydrogenase